MTTSKSERTGSGAFDRDELAEPLSPIIGCNGDVIPSDARLSDALMARRIDCSLVICTAFTGRHRILERIIEESFHGNEVAGVHWMLTGSTPEDLEFIQAINLRQNRVAGFITENRPLGRKWQTCFNMAWRYFNADLYAINGSDDILSSKLIDHVIRRHRANQKKAVKHFLPAMYASLEWLVWNIDARSPLAPLIIKCNYAYETAFEPLGAGRFYTGAFVDETRGLIFESDKERLLDDRGFFEARDRGKKLEYLSVDDGPIVSIKGDWDQMNSMEAFFKTPTLKIDEYTFEGRHMLSQALSPATMAFLQKPPRIEPQLVFSAVHATLA